MTLKAFMDKGKRERTIIGRFLLLMLPFFITLAAEYVSRRDWAGTLDWAGNFFGYYILGTMMVTALLFFVLGLANRVMVGFVLVCGSAILFSAVNYFKLAARGEPLYATDFRLATEIFGVIDGSNAAITDSIYLVVAFFLLLLLVMPYLGLHKPLLSWPLRLVVCVVSAAFLCMVYFTGMLGTNSRSDYIYGEKGFVFGFLSNAQFRMSGGQFAIGSPRYTEAFMEEVLAGLKAEFPATYDQAEEKKPNVIVVMSESFFDITRYDALQFSEEPVPHFKALCEQAVYGRMMSITFGGGTANVEYEFLTGLLSKYFSLYQHAYQTEVNSPIVSLASIFKAKGYEAVAMHTYNKEFYERDRVYPLLGFDRFVGLEDLHDPQYEGRYVADAELTRMIIEEYEDKGEKPLFLFAVSMENHQPFTEDKFERNPIRVLNTDLSPDLKVSVETFLHGLHDADRQLGELVNYFSRADEEVCILFFGDHLPTLGQEFEFYRELGIVENTQSFSPEELERILATDFVLWSNAKGETKTMADSVYVKAIGSNQLGNALLDYLSMSKPLFYHFLDMVKRDILFMARPDIIIDAEGHLYDEMPAAYADLDEMYKLFQYDMLFGERFITDELMKIR